MVFGGEGEESHSLETGDGFKIDITVLSHSLTSARAVKVPDWQVIWVHGGLHQRFRFTPAGRTVGHKNQTINIESHVPSARDPCH